MSADGSDDRDEFVADYDNATPADIIEEAEPDEHAGASAEDTDADEEGAVAGSFAPDVAVTPQAPTPENTLFVALGVFLTIVALADTAVGLGPGLVVGVAIAVGVTTLACYGVLVWTTPDT